MFKKFQQGGMMPPQPQGQMMPPDPQQMALQQQGGAQLPDEVIQLLMTLPENIRQYLLSLPEDKMMMELQKIMQEKMAQQQGQGQQGPPMPPQGGEQMAPPMMGKYGMKMRAKMGLTTDPKSKIDLGKMEDSSDIRSAQKKVTPYLITKPKTTTPTIAPVVQPTINSNPNAPKLGQKVMLGTKAATIIDMGNGKLAFKYDDGSGIQEVRMAQTETIPTNIDNNTAVVNDNQVQSRNLTKTSSSGVTNSIVPKSKVVITKPAQNNNSPTAGQQVTTNPVTKPKKVTTSPNNTQWTDKELKDEFMQGKILDPITITPKGNYRGVTEPTVQNQGRSSSGPSIDNSSYIKHVNRVSEIDRQIKKLESNKYSYNNEFKIGRLKAEKRHWEDIIMKAKRDTFKKSTNNTTGIETLNNRGYSDSDMKYKSGGQLLSALKVSTPLKNIMDKKVEMFKFGGKYQTGSNIVNKKGTAIWNKEENKNMIKKNYLQPELDKPSVKGAYTPVPSNPNSKIMSQAAEDSLNNEMYKRIKNAPKYGQGGKMKLKTCKHGC